MKYLMQQKQIKALLQPSLNNILKYWGSNNAKKYAMENTIAIASSGRGGSTWLAEIVGSLPGYPIVWEPLHLGKNPECKKYGYNWNTYIPLNGEEQRKKEYLREILTGNNLSTNTISSLAFNPRNFLNFKGFVVKFVNANLLLNWMLEQFPISAILMIRHPCAVVESQLRHSAWNHVNKNNMTIPEQLTVDYPYLLEVFEGIETREEVLAFEWALKTYTPLVQPQPKSLYITTYEGLVEQPILELNKIFNFLGKTVPPQAYKKLKTASSTTQKLSNIALNKNPLDGWKKRLSVEQIDNILRVVHKIGIDFYTDSLIPNYNQLSFFATKS